MKKGLADFLNRTLVTAIAVTTISSGVLPTTVLATEDAAEIQQEEQVVFEAAAESQSEEVQQELQVIDEQAVPEVESAAEELQVTTDTNATENITPPDAVPQEAAVEEENSTFIESVKEDTEEATDETAEEPEEEVEEEEETLEEKKEGCEIQMFGDYDSYMGATAAIVGSVSDDYNGTISMDLQNEIIADSNGNVLEAGDAVMEQVVEATTSPAEATPVLESAGYNVVAEGGSSVVIEDPYTTHRLYVKGNISDSEGAVSAIGYNGEYFLQYENTEDTIAAYEAFAATEGVQSVQPDIVFHASELTEEETSDSELTFEPAFYTGLEGTVYSDASGGIGFEAFQNKLTEDGAQPDPVIVAVLDTGVSANDFLSGRVLNGHNFIDNNTDVTDNFASGHGTNVAGIIVDSTLPNVSVLPVKVLDANGDGSASSVKLGIQYAIEAGADVINLSLDVKETTGTNNPLEESFSNALNAGIVTCVAAGNTAEDTSVHYPARSDRVITVSALNEDLQTIAPYSAYGDAVDFAMPGSNIMSASSDGAFSFPTGTSFAVANVSAVAATLKSFNNSMNQDSLYGVMAGMCEDLGEEGWDPYYGNGLINMGELNLSNLCLHNYTTEYNSTETSCTRVQTCTKCGENSSETLTVDKAKVVLNVGNTETIQASVDSDGTPVFTSSDEGIATVNDAGVVSGIQKGQTIIRVQSPYDSNIFIECPVVVKNADDILVDSVTINERYIQMNVGDEKQVSTTILPENATNKTLLWESNDPTIVSVDENGKLKAHAVGYAIITATAQDGSGVFAYVQASVSKMIESITIDKTSLELNPGEKSKLNATILPTDASMPYVMWSSSNTEIATVEYDGTVTAVIPGKVTVTATAMDGSDKSASCEVTVKDIKVSKVTLDKTALSLETGKTGNLTATVEPNNATNKTLRWETSNATVATVDNTGKITAKKAGSAVIKAVATDGSGQSASCTVTVKDPVVQVSKVTVDKTSASVTEGNTVQLTATVTPSNATNKGVTWSSANNGVAKVDANGKVTAVKAGTTTITVTSKANANAKATCKITVTAKPVAVSEIKLNKTTASFAVGGSTQLTATVLPNNATNKDVTWTSSDSKIATVNATGKVTGVKAGTATITATAKDGSKKAASCKVAVLENKKAAESVSLNKTEAKIPAGKTEQLTATVKPSDAANKKIVWSSDNQTVAKVDANGKVTAVKEGTAKITATPDDKNAKPATCTVTVTDNDSASVSYRTHVQTYGWSQGYVKDGATAGTTGQSKRLEAINIKLENAPYNGGITYRTHVQTYGWQDWKSNDAAAGTSGQSKRLEAIQIKLTGDMGKYYDVWYQTHIQHFGWTGWAKNGECCGSEGYAYRLEGIKIKLIKKGAEDPGTSESIFFKNGSAATNGAAYYAGKLVMYDTHVQTYGWQAPVTDGAMAGTEGQSKRLEGIHISLADAPYRGGITYRTHVQTYGWQGWKADGAMAGTSGESKRLEAIQIKLTGEMEKAFDVYYQTHIQTFGWTGWAKNGEECGSAGYSKRLEGIRIKLVPKNGPAPGKTENKFYKK